MHKEESQTDLGKIRIHKNVIASIASLATIEIEGVKDIGKGFASGLAEVFVDGWRRAKCWRKKDFKSYR